MYSTNVNKDKFLFGEGFCGSMTTDRCIQQTENRKTGWGYGRDKKLNSDSEQLFIMIL